MSQIDNLLEKLKKYFHRLSGPNYVRLMDTPHAWGTPFDEQIMPHSFKRQEEFAIAIIEIIKKALYRCDISSLNSPDADWRKIILQAIDNGLSKKMGRTRPTQFRFLFGQSPTVFLDRLSAVETGSFDYVAFKDELLKLIQSRAQDWELMPEIWISRFFRLDEGMINSFMKNLYPNFLPINDTRMTWNHTKIIAVDGVESLVGGHNLNMDLFRNYPPVHDVSIIVHGAAALDAQFYLNEMWLCNSDLLKKEYFDVKSMSWQIGSELPGKPEDPLQDPAVMMSVTKQQKYLLQLHEDIDNQCGAKRDDYSKIEEYKRADRILSVGKYWTGPNINTDYHHGSEIMKEHLIKNARYIIRISQQDLISAWKKRWVDHTVCRWLIEALLANKSLQLHVVVSPLNAAAGAAGDQYSFGSGAERTFELLKYYITHDLHTDELLSDENGERADVLKRILIAPFFFTDRLSEQQTTEGKTYQWPNLDLAAYTATLKQQPLTKKPPSRGIIGSSLMSTIEGSGYIYPKVPAAPANHAKLMIIDDELYVVGSDNLYPGHLSEFNYVVEGKKAVEELIAEYWQQVWKYSSPHVFPKLNQDLYCSSGDANQKKNSL